MSKWWIILSWGRDGDIFSRFPFMGYEAMAWNEARELARHYLQDRVVSRIQVIQRGTA